MLLVRFLLRGRERKSPRILRTSARGPKRTAPKRTSAAATGSPFQPKSAATAIWLLPQRDRQPAQVGIGDQPDLPTGQP
jgi:hypothetical protein